MGDKATASRVQASIDRMRKAIKDRAEDPDVLKEYQVEIKRFLKLYRGLGVK